LKIAVVGSGRQGQDAVKDLLDKVTSPGVTKVLAIDFNEEKVMKFVEEVGDDRLAAAKADASKPDELAKVLEGYDSTINLAWYHLNLEVMRACLKAGTHYTDAGGLFRNTVKQLKLDDDFRKANLTAALGCGGSPGTVNMLAKIGADRLDEIDEIHCRLGSGPAVYTLHSETATLAQFLGKGCKTVTFKQTLSPEMMEPLKMLVDLGLCSSEPIEVGGVKIVPYDFIVDFLENAEQAKNIFGYSGRTIVDEFVIPAVEYIDGKFVDVPPLSGAEMISFPEILGDQMGVPTIIAKGRIKGDPAVVLVSHKLEKGARWARMVRGSSGIFTSVVAQMMAGGVITKRGALPPEAIVDPKLFLQELKKRGHKGLLVTTMITQKT
jgi:lysine 6-dehydrogenase